MLGRRGRKREAGRLGKENQIYFKNEVADGFSLEVTCFNFSARIWGSVMGLEDWSAG